MVRVPEGLQGGQRFAAAPENRQKTARRNGAGGGFGACSKVYFTSKIFLNSAPHFWISASESSRMAITLASLMPSIGG